MIRSVRAGYRFLLGQLQIRRKPTWPPSARAAGRKFTSSTADRLGVSARPASGHQAHISPAASGALSSSTYRGNDTLRPAGRPVSIACRDIKVTHNGVNPDAFSFLSRADARAFFGKRSVDRCVRSRAGNTANLYAIKTSRILIQKRSRRPRLYKTMREQCALVGVAGRKRSQENPGAEKRSSKRERDPRRSASSLAKDQLLKASAASISIAHGVFVFSSAKEGFPWAILRGDGRQALHHRRRHDRWARFQEVIGDEPLRPAGAAGAAR